jgi:4-amino-4-deoxy-L-arabinose transferase-like glycosyltransferase
MPSPLKFRELPLLPLAGAWALAAAAFAAWRLWLGNAYGLPLLSGGGALFLALLLCLGWLLADPPQLLQGEGRRLGLAYLGLVILFSGEQLLWLRAPDKALYFYPGYALLLLGAGMLAAAAWRAGEAKPGEAIPRRAELGILALLLALGAAARLYHLGSVPSTWWYDEVNLARAVQAHAGSLPVYVTENVENPGMYLWIAALVFKFRGAGVEPLRQLSAFFGWLSLLPFYFLARRLLGAAFGLAALALFCAMRWTLIPQHIGFMSGFAMFWTLSAVYFYWRALGTKRALDFALAGLCLGFTLHAYTPTRLVIPLLGLFSLLQWRLLKGVPSRAWLALGACFLLVAGPMLLYVAFHWGDYSLRAGQVSIFNDVRAKGWGELWISFCKHLQCFNYRGDFNARHNLSFWPQLDFVSGGLFAAAMLWAHLRFFRDPRAALFTLWFWIMLSAGIFSMTVEAPQAHRSILVAPVAALAVAWFALELSRALAPAWKGGWPAALKAAALAAALAVPLFNAGELYANWPGDAATWRSFSPESTLAARRAAQSPPDWEVYVSPLDHEYQFHGFERDQFTRYTLGLQGRSFYPLRLSQALTPGAKGVLAIWGDSDPEMTAAMRRDFPGVPIEEARDPFEAKNDYLAAAIPWDRIPDLKHSKRKDPFFFRP